MRHSFNPVNIANMPIDPFEILRTGPLKVAVTWEKQIWS